MFCDHDRDFVYVHLMWDFTVDEMILAAKAFEKVLSQASVGALSIITPIMVHFPTKDFLITLIVRIRK